MSQRKHRSRAIVSRAAMVEPLEVRRMLAVFTGSNNSDTIQITRVGSFTHVIINGNDNATTDVNITVNALGADDFVLMDYVHPAIVVNLGTGNDRVTYGGPSHDIFGDLPQTLLVGDTGTDTIVFDDRNGPVGVTREYLCDDISAMNQVLFDFENLTFMPRHDEQFNGSGNRIQFSDGFPVSQTITVEGGGHNDRTHIGTETAPVDLDRQSLRFFMRCNNNVTIYDQDADNSALDFGLYLEGSATQHLAKGGFDLSCAQPYFYDFDIHTGSTNDRFGIGGLWIGQVFIDGNGGDDSVFTTNVNGRDNDLDAISPYDPGTGSFGTCVFRGGEGIDFIDLDDSADQTGDGDEDYSFEGSGTAPLFVLDKSGPSLDSIVPFSFDLTVERVNVVGDAEGNAITFETAVGHQLTLNGGGGNDTFGLEPGVALQQCRGAAIIIGGPGTDALVIGDDDPAFQAINNYTFTLAGVMTYGGASGTLGSISYNAALEDFILDENDAAATTFLNSKPPSVRLNLNLAGGDDTVIVGGGDLDNSGIFNPNTTLIGGAGTDSIRFDDHSDTDATGETETYTFSTFTLAKGSPLLTYSSFEAQTLLAADGGVQPNTINVNAFSGQIDSTTINGGANRPNTVNVGNGNLTNVAGTLDINLGAAGGTINFNDQSATVARSYQISATAMTSPRPITFSGASALNLNGGPLSDNFLIRGSAAGTASAFNGNNGSDSITLGQGNIDADLGGAVTINGGTGVNILTLNNALDAAAEVQTLTSATFTDGLTHGYSSIQDLIVNEGAGGTNLAVNSISIPATINGGSGDDAISIGNGSLASNLGANVVVSGNAGTDSLSLLDQNNGSIGTYTFSSVNQFRFGDVSTGKTVTFSGIEQATLRSGIRGDTIDVSTASIPLSIFAGDGNDAVTVLASTMPVTVDTGSEQDVPFGFRQGDSLTVGTSILIPPPTATVVVPQSDTVVGMAVRSGSTLRLTNGAVLNKAWPAQFFIDLGTELSGTIDVGSGAFLWRSGGSIIPDFRALLTRGRNNGAWNGTGAGGSINSSSAATSGFGDGVGYGLGSQIAPTSIGPFSIAAGDTLVRYTLDGDADLSGAVNLSDFNRLATNFGQPNRAWVDGDSTYDGSANLIDFNALAGNFGTALGPEAFRSNSIRGTRGGDELRELLEELT